MAQTYNMYFGDFHSHTWYSDGNKDQIPATYTTPVARAMTYAQGSPSMNFLGVSDHNHNEGLNMTLAYWRAGVHEADSLNQDNVFVSMYGQEWGTISGGGHVLVYGTDRLFGWNPGVYDVFVAKSNYTTLFDSVKKYGGFCYLAHPVSSDYSGIFSGPYNANWDSVVSGVALRNGPATSTNTSETNPSSTSYEARYHDLLRLGYHVAPCANQDNHNTTYGRVNQQRTVVLATSLTRANVFDALRNRRAYATDDHNLQLRFEVGTHQMGEIFSQGGPIPFRVKVVDGDGPNLVSAIELRYGVPGSGATPTVLNSVANQDSLIFSQPQAPGTTYYYYAYVRETSGRLAWSAPMWITVPTGPLPGAFAQSQPPNTSTDQPIAGTLRWQSSADATQYDLYLDANDPPTALVSADQTDTTFTFSGLLNDQNYSWKIVAKNTNGTIVATGAPWHFTTIVSAPGAFVHLAPLNAASNQPVAGTLTWAPSANAARYDVYLDTVSPPAAIVSANQPGTSFDYSGLLNSKEYYWKAVAKNAAGPVTASGAPWIFTTIGPSPGSFSLSSPPPNASSQPLGGILVWNSSAGAATYDVYLDTNNPPVARVDSNRADTSCNYGALLPGRSYHWKIVAKNANGVTVASDAPRSFSTVNVPVAATDILATEIAYSSLKLSWTDNASDETGYRVYCSALPAGPFVQRGTDLPVDAVSFTDTGLSINQRYYYKVVPFSAVGEGNFAALDAVTLAAVPGAPVISGVGYSSLRLTVDAGINPAATEFAIRAVVDSVGRYVQADGSLGSTVVWRTLSEWGGGSGSAADGLHSCKLYLLDVMARNLDIVVTAFGASAGQVLPCFEIEKTTMSGWNLLSMPVKVTDPRRSAVFPGSASDAFFYQGNYLRRDTLRCGSGFWIKYTSGGPLNLQGEPRFADTVGLNAGWNIIGSLSAPVSVNSVVEQPSSIVVSRYFGYSGAYVQTDSLYPMQGYWVKANAPGKLVLSSSGMAPSKMAGSAPEAESELLNSITFEDKAGHRQTLRFGSAAASTALSAENELPPVPPSGAFDVRFGDGRSIAGIAQREGDLTQRIPILLQAISYPVRASVRLADKKLIELALVNGSTTVPISESHPVLVDQPIASLSLLISNAGRNERPKATVLHQNYPNPFNPSTEIRYDLSSPSRVQLSVLNLLGQTVEVLFDGDQDAGYHHVTWKPEVAGGVYFSRLDVIPHDAPTSRSVQLRKLVYLK